LASMIEGVVAIDSADRVLRVNQAAAKVMGVSVAGALSKPLSQVVRHVELLRFVEDVRASSSPLERDIRISLGGEKTLHATGAALRDLMGNLIGVLLVFSDVTRLRRLENMRREFVANVSHELRTPITAIKGFVETLEDGALHNPADAKRFIDIIGRHAARLSAIFDDLLTLSRIEEGNKEEAVPLVEGIVSAVARGAIEACHARAAEKGVLLAMEGSDTVRALINASLLEQAIVNLIQNAITYSEPRMTVNVTVEQDAQEIRIKVQDQGIGIESIHLPRLFERFYRVDKSRVRSAGGTGLGLAIVKHVAESHHGQVSVGSVPGKGSTFVIHLPRPAEKAAGSSGAVA
ncbi:MAG: PAS domain-containing protein, partial [Oligoflexia bacterium]|nr:PAS domain-containing protein [Oligoflexia bacterium]